MTNLIVRGGRPLRGTLTPSANKNAVLPILCATLLTEETVTLHRVPDITDVRKILDFFRNLGSSVAMDFETGTLVVKHGAGLDPKAAHLPLGMRSTLMLIPALLHRFSAASIEEDATGCTLGAGRSTLTSRSSRPLAPKSTGSRTPFISRRRRDFRPPITGLTTPRSPPLKTSSYAQPQPGRSQLTNAACEPHVQEFCTFLTRMGAKIEGVGGSRIVVTGVEALHGVEFTFADDFHEIATFLAMGAITGGEVKIKNGAVDQFPLLDRTFAKFGVEVTHQDGYSSAKIDGRLKVREPFTTNILTKVEAAPWPYVPADLLPISIALGVRAEGSVMYWNKVYDGRLGWTSELGKFGAHAVLCDPHRLIIYGGRPLMPATVESPILFGSPSPSSCWPPALRGSP